MSFKCQTLWQHFHNTAVWVGSKRPCIQGRVAVRKVASVGGVGCGGWCGRGEVGEDVGRDKRMMRGGWSLRAGVLIVSASSKKPCIYSARHLEEKWPQTVATNEASSVTVTED